MPSHFFCPHSTMAVRTVILDADADPAAAARELLESSRSSHWSRPFRVLLLGPRFTGKTSIINRLLYSDEVFRSMAPPPAAPATPDADYGVDLHRTELNIDGRPAVLHVWDIGGSHSLPQWRNTYLQGSDVLVLAFDASSSTSLNDAAAWICANDADIHARCVKALVANKVDVKSPATYATIEEGRGIASAHGWRFYETSARDGTGVTTMFHALVRAAAVRAVAEAAAAAQSEIHASGRERPRTASSRPCCACASCVVS
jgi:GTPase SAR1 family protein